MVEFVHVDLAQVTRGTSVADAAMRRAMKALEQDSANTLAFPVDQRNSPTRGRNRQRRFVVRVDRDARIVSSLVIEG